MTLLAAPRRCEDARRWNGIREAKPRRCGGDRGDLRPHVLHGSASYDVIPPPAEHSPRQDRRRRGGGLAVPGRRARRNGRRIRIYRPSSATARISLHRGGQHLCPSGARGAGNRRRLARRADRPLRRRRLPPAHRRHRWGRAGISGGPRQARLPRGWGGFHSVGWKHGRWLDSLYMQLELPLAPD